MKQIRPIEFRFWGVAQKPPCFIDLKKWVVYGTAAESFEDMFNNPLLVPQEYTGLLDKNGKKIFEGDIIKFFGKWDEKGNVLEPDYEPYQVVWFMGGLRALKIKRNKILSFHQHNDILGVGHTNNEVIGNIFETTELLK